MKRKLLTTLELLYSYNACSRGLDTFLESLSKTQRADKYRLINILDILESNGVFDFLWTLGCTTTLDFEVKRNILHDLLLVIRPEHFKMYPTDYSFDDLIQTLKIEGPLTHSKIIFCATKIMASTDYKNNDDPREDIIHAYTGDRFPSQQYTTEQERKIMIDKQIKIINDILE